MTPQLGMVLALLCGAVAMFALGRPRTDVVALLMIAALPLTGVISVPESLAGFADPNIVLIAMLFVIGEGLLRTGVAQRLGDLLVARAGGNEARLIVLLMVIVAGVGSVMSSTGVVAIFVPIVLRIARNTGVAAGRLMMPLSVAALISGMMTLVATAPNLVIHAELVREGFEGFRFFSFTPFGVPLLAIAIVYMLVVRRWLGGARSQPRPSGQRAGLGQWIDEYTLAGRGYRFRVRPGSAAVGKVFDTLAAAAIPGLNLLAIERQRRFAKDLLPPGTLIEAGDVLFFDLWKPGADLEGLSHRLALERLPLAGAYFSEHAQHIGMAEVLLPPGSSLIGKTVVEARLRAHHDVSVIGLKHGRTAEQGDILDEPLKAGDTLLVVGLWQAIRRLRSDMDLIIFNLPAEFDEVSPAASRAPFALLSLALVVVLMVSGLLPNVQAALIGCLLMGLSGCVDLRSAYRAIHWPSLVLIVGMLPFSLALQRTGGVDLAAQALMDIVGSAGPRTVLAVIFAVTAALGMFISNTATAVLMAPVALAIAQQLQASPYPFAMTVALAASAAFVTPVSSPVNTLVVGPGDYGFMDFVRIGLPLVLLVGLASIALVPVILPF
ncbi:SLC13 family permease [Variovorax saccharolyticus]|uniref:SLC13 family permease n=1 Tax=Variovorax saccharolyticus TaxID=3053516 RepID=UPI002575BFC1|nr:SLC13 family permease [Variovorax sp. J31P216]MDM0024476.1 SLC13 family permease [Variovorax sp. J31P216]